MRPRFAHRTLLPESGQCVSLHFPRLLNIFLGHTVTAHEEEVCNSVSGSAGCHTVVTQTRWHSPGNGPPAMSWNLVACFRNPKMWTKVITVRCKKQKLEGFSSSCSAEPFKAQPTEKCKSCHKVQYLGSTQDVSPQYPRLLYTDLGSLDLTYEKTWQNRHLDVGLPFPVIVGIIPIVSGSGKIASEKWPASKLLESVSVTQHSVLGEVSSF